MIIFKVIKLINKGYLLFNLILCNLRSSLFKDKFKRLSFKNLDIVFILNF